MKLLRTAAMKIAMISCISLLLIGSLRTVTKAEEGMSMDMGEDESGTRITVNGHFLKTPANLRDDLTDLRLPVRDVAEALKMQVRWDSKHHAIILGDMPSDSLWSEHHMNMSSMAGMPMLHLVIEGHLASPETDPMLMGKTLYASAEEFASELGLKYHYDSSRHLVQLVTREAEDQFKQEEAAVSDVFNGKGMTPKILADGTKEFTLTAQMHPWAPAKGVLTTAWTYNGQVAGPTIRVTEGDKVRILFKNDLSEPSTVHWHGLLIPNAMDGVPGVTQPEVQPGGTFVYEFTASHAGTFIYHSHYDDMTQMGSGLYGAFIIDQKQPGTPAGKSGDLTATTAYDHDYTMVLGGFHVNTNMEGEEDYYTINGRSYPDTLPIQMKLGETARVRLINMDTMELHTMHLHGMDFQVIARNGSPVSHPETMNTVLLGPGETVDIAFRANNPGDWMFHCHILDHTMNGGDMMSTEMGGLITLVQIKPQ